MVYMQLCVAVYKIMRKCNIGFKFHAMCPTKLIALLLVLFVPDEKLKMHGKLECVDEI
jgi:hypothetical protein